jgi:coproporphyrinogen III oxidase
MPPNVKWVYDYSPINGGQEEELIKILKSPKNWV